MARLLPRIDVETIDLKPERDVARALVGLLTDDSVVHHSYPWLRPFRRDREPFLREGEADFVVIVPDLGLLVLEVKGGEIIFDPDDHKWYRRLGGVREEITDPLNQARKNLHALHDQILERTFRGRDRLPCTYGYAVVFPDCTYAGPPPPGGDSAEMLGAKDLLHLGKRLREVLRNWSRTDPPRAVTPEDLLCFNRGLAEWLRDAIEVRYQDLITVRHFGVLCREWCTWARMSFPVPPADDPAAAAFWRDTAPNLLDQAISQVGVFFDAVVVDEAQEFHPNW